MVERDYDADLRQELRRIRTVAGMKQEAVAAALNTHQVNVSRWEREMNPTLTDAAAFAEACGYELDVRFHKRGDVREVRATPDGATAATLVDSMDEADRALVLELLHALPGYRKHRNAVRGMIQDSIDALRALMRREG
jgi:transcriptional regulator with XRE-family HTH domain